MINLIYATGESESRRLPVEEGESRPEDLPCGSKHHRPPLLASLALYAGIITALILMTPALQRYPVSTSILISEWMFIMIPCLIFLRALHVRPKSDLRITGISIGTAIGAALVSISGILLTGELVAIQNEIVPIPPEYLEMMRELFTLPGDVHWTYSAFVFGISPAICEELLFRGILLQGALGKVSPSWAVLITGLLFGLFHLDPYRFVGTTVLGFIMAYVALRASSLLASMVYHAANNLMILLAMNAAPLKEVPWLMEEAHVPFALLLLSGVVFIGGLVFIRTNPKGVERPLVLSDPGKNFSDDEP